jgi:2-polyprenyl-3-methyl-5-hydroxy-6-metoxy-1,4-benzoquinol methylase
MALLVLNPISGTPIMLISCLCTEAMLLSKQSQEWGRKLGEKPGHMHRKIWEWCFICQALSERGMLRPGKHGLGFAVGQEPLTAMFASRGARITATDLAFEEAESAGWVTTGQHASGIRVLNSRNICESKKFEKLVDFKVADMNDIPSEFNERFDFVWSSCALEHLGGLGQGMEFIYNAMRCLKPGGFAIHTTEYNVSSNTGTVDSGATVLYRKKDIEEVVATLLSQGHKIDLDLREGTGKLDQIIDLPPYEQLIHLKLQIDQYVVTSVGLIVQKKKNSPMQWAKSIGCDLLARVGK